MYNLGPQATRQHEQYQNDKAETTAFERYGVKLVILLIRSVSLQLLFALSVYIVQAHREFAERLSNNSSQVS